MQTVSIMMRDSLTRSLNNCWEPVSLFLIYLRCLLPINTSTTKSAILTPTKTPKSEFQADRKFNLVHALITPLAPTIIAHHRASELNRVTDRSRSCGAIAINPITPPTQSETKSTWKMSAPIASPWFPALLACEWKIGMIRARSVKSSAK